MAKRSIKNLVVVKSDPKPVLVAGTAIATGDKLYACDDDGVSCHMVLETNPRKRQVLLYNVVKLTTIWKTEHQLGGNQYGSGQRWATTAMDAAR